MEFAVLGPVRVRRGTDAAPLAGGMQRMLLAILLSRANESVPVDTLTDALWDGRPADRAAANLQLHVHRLRRALGDADRVSFGPGGYRLRVHPGELDAERFELLVEEATEIAGYDPLRCAELARKALGLWRGRPYEALDVPLLADAAERLSDRRLTAVELLYEAELARGIDVSAVAELTDLVREHPLRERMHALLMVALYRSGRQADALRVFRDARQVLVDELGLEPGPQLQELQRRILDGEPVSLGAADTRPQVPAQLPADVRGFVGRDPQLAELDGVLAPDRESMSIAVLAGTAGAGKTALAVHWAHRVRGGFADGQLYVDLRGYGPDRPLSPAQALAGFLRALGVDGEGIPNELAERSARFRSLVAGRRLLVVLDNARTVDQVRPLLPGTETCCVLVTSRDALTGLGAREGAQRIHLDRLPVDEAVRLLDTLLGEQSTAVPESTARLAEQCARLPLALRIAADLVRTRPVRGVAGLVDELADERHRLDLLEIEDSRSAVRVVFSWSYQQLSDRTRRAFRRLGLHPGHTWDAMAVAALADCDEPAARRSLDVLVRAHLLDETPDGRFQAHDLLRAYAAELVEADESAPEREAATTRLLDHELASVVAAIDLVAPYSTDDRPQASHDGGRSRFADADSAFGWLDRERANLVALAGLRRSESLQLSAALARYLEMSDHLDEALILHTHALEVARGRGDRDAEAGALRRLGSVTQFLNRYDEATQHVTRALEIAEELGDVRNQARALNSFGSIARMTGRVREARTYYERALELHSDSSDQDRFGPLVNLVFVLGRLGEYDQALRHSREATAIAEAYDDPMLKTHALYRGVTLAEQSGRLVEAIEEAERLADLARDSGARVLEAVACYIRGKAYRQLGDCATALHWHRQAMDRARPLGDRRLMIEFLNGLGQARCQSGDPGRALTDHREALDLARQLGDREEEGRALAGMGDAHEAMGDAERASELWRRARDIYRELGLPEAEELAARLGVR